MDLAGPGRSLRSTLRTPAARVRWRCDVAIVGGGPAGLACAVEAARRGLSAVVLERRAMPCDKACGEGLMPAGVRAVERLGVRELLSPEDAWPFVGIRYVQEDGSSAEGRLPGGGGLGVRRIALVSALSQRARGLGAQLVDRVEVRRHLRTSRGVWIATSDGPCEARVLVAADGLSSEMRHAEGLDVPSRGPRRFGMRRHFRVAPWSPFVEVHFAEDAEAYVAPVGGGRVGIAFLWDAARLAPPVSFAALLGRFPALAERLAGAEPDSGVRGAGPLARGARALVKDRFVLLGDAAGYVDAITGEGLSLSLSAAETLGEILPDALARGATAESLRPYEEACRRRYRRYSWLARALVAISGRPALRRAVIHSLGRHPRVFDRILAAVAAR